ncbi:MAG: transglycosylase SLT domain-containing protein [Propionibacteriaceae bacterium]
MRRPPLRAWVKASIVLPAALALALPLSTLSAAANPVTYPAVPGASCTAPDTSTSTSAASGGSRESVARQAAARYFPADQVDVATAVAGAESSWNPTAVNKAAGGNYGLWQINSVHKSLLKGRSWRTPEVNAWMAYQVWDAADGRKGDNQGRWTPWSAYNSGSYLRYLKEGAAPVASGDCLAPIAPDVRVGTWNVLRTNSKTNIAAGAREMTTHADVFGLQELGSSSKRAAAAKGAVGFTMSTDNTAVPIFYNSYRYTLMEEGREQAFAAGQKVERDGADKSGRTGAKWVSWVHLIDNDTLQDFYVLNTHLLVGAQNSAQDRKNHPRRVALYNKQIATVTRLADGFRASGAPVYATCDCNVNYSPEAGPVVTMGQHGLAASWEGLDSKATHGKRFIDYVWSNVAASSQFTGNRNGSDHRSLIVSYRPSSITAVRATAAGSVSTRTVTDPKTAQTYVVPIPAGKAGKAVNFALDQLGDQWKFGSHGPDAWDSSGLTAASWRKAGVTMTAQSDAQRRSEPHVSLAKAQAGDVFWRQGYVSIYLGQVGNDRLVVGSLKSSGAVVLHTAAESDIDKVLRPTNQ